MSKFSAEKSYGLFANQSNRKIISELEVIGANVILFPAVEVKEISGGELENTIDKLSDYNWLIFPDIYTVEFFLQKLTELNFDFYELDEIRVCAYGESVADRLRYAQLHADVIPNTIKTPEVLQAIKDYIFDEDELREARFLILKEKESSPAISSELKNLGAQVAETSAYEVIHEDRAQNAKLKSLLKGGAIDEFIFTSPFDIINLAHLFPNENLSDILAETSLYASDNTTQQSIQEFRLG